VEYGGEVLVAGQRKLNYFAAGVHKNISSKLTQLYMDFQLYALLMTTDSRTIGLYRLFQSTQALFVTSGVNSENVHFISVNESLHE